jgi:hypothetical protein
LLDEPDAHLELLRQRQIYDVLTKMARALDCQIIAASHSEVILEEAADRDVVVAFVGTPHRIDDRGSQVLKALKEIGFNQYYQAEQTGWVLYLEGATDLAIVRAFAETRGHRARRLLDRPFVHYVANQPEKARYHFHGLREGKKDLVGFALFDRMPLEGHPQSPLVERAWQRREIENYLSMPAALVAWAEETAADRASGPLFDKSEREKWKAEMQARIVDFVPPVALRDRSDSWWRDTKMSDEFLDRLFPAFFERLGLPNLMSKTDYHQLAPFVPNELIDPEIDEVLEAIAVVAEGARPMGSASTGD